ncbi:MAG: SDR family oxidoreductase [Candidatus Poseidoniaceae archaeon]|jgi:pteridine reductase|nr:SDR family oxidoreductase [Candidatus Poseidoniaceae archaeon]MDP7203362.1 SDR family oxidoreductase [Candidatus Poseidoniaceae archaeon]
MPLPLHGQAVLVTGGARRIGASIVRHLAAAGAQVLIHCHTSTAEAEELAEEVVGIVVQGDLTEESGRQQIVSAVQSNGKGLFCLVHSASVFIANPSTDEEVRQMQINSKAPQSLTHSLIEELRAVGGSIISITDASTDRPWADYTAYSASKQSLRDWTLALAQELAPDVRANCIAPGAILPASDESHLVDSIAARIPLGRWGEPDDIAAAVVFLSQARYITSQVLTVDGGWSAAGHHP